MGHIVSDIGHAVSSGVSAIGNGLSDVGHAVSNGVSDVGHAVSNGVSDVGNFVGNVVSNPKAILGLAGSLLAPELSGFFLPMVGGSALAAGALTGATIGGGEGLINGGNLCSLLKGAVVGGLSSGLAGEGGALGSSTGSRLAGSLGSKVGGYLGSQFGQGLIGAQPTQSPYQSTIPSGGYVGCQPLNPLAQLNTLPQSVYSGSTAGLPVSGCAPHARTGLAPLHAIYTPPCAPPTALPPCSPYAPITGSQGVHMAHMADGGVITGIGGLAHGGLPSQHHPDAPEGHNPEFITGKTGFYARGKGTGQSDDIPAMLHQGDFVMDADTVSAFGDGSSKAGAERLEQFRRSLPVRNAEGGPALPAKIADGEYVLPAAFVTRLGGGDNKKGAELLNKMREELRAHKRSAPDDKIPPKAKPPMEYLRMARG